MERIKRSSFINAFNRMKKIHRVSTAEVAKHSSLSRSYVYHVVSPRYKIDITTATAKKIGNGLGLNRRQMRNWINSMSLATKGNYRDYNPAKKTSRQSQRIPTGHPETFQQRNLVQTIRDLMSTKGISTRKLAIQSGLNEQRVSNYIHGNTAKIPKLTIVRLARGLNVNPTMLLNILKTHLNTKLGDRTTAGVHHPQSLGDFPHHHVRRSVHQIMKDINKLNDADIAIVDLIVNRIAEAELYDKKKS